MYPHARSNRERVLTFALLIFVLIAPGAFAQDTTKPSAGAAPHTLTVGGADCMCIVDCVSIAGESSNAVTLPRGGSVTITINLACLAQNGLELVVTGIPAGITASLHINPALESATLILSASNTVALGDFTLTVTAISGALTRSMPLEVTIVDGTPVAGASCHIGYDIVAEWDGMFEAVLSIDNTGVVPAPSGWTLTWSFANGQTVSQLWNGTVTQAGPDVVLQGDADIPVGGSNKGVGFLGTKLANVPNQVPRAFSLNGVPCSVN